MTILAHKKKNWKAESNWTAESSGHLQQHGRTHNVFAVQPNHGDGDEQQTGDMSVLTELISASAESSVQELQELMALQKLGTLLRNHVNFSFLFLIIYFLALFRVTPTNVHFV